MTRIDHRPHVQQEWRGVQRYGDRRIHSIATETVWRRLAHCGVAVENASGSRALINCTDCLHQLRLAGRVG